MYFLLVPASKSSRMVGWKKKIKREKEREGTL